MKYWPLRWKIAIYAAALGIIATIAGAGTTWIIMHYWEVAAFDQRLATDAQELFRDIENFQGGWANNQQAFKEILVPLALRDRFIEVVGANGEVLYLSPNLASPMSNDGDQGIHTRRIGGRRIRVGIFRQDGLTAFIGADAREVNQIGRDIIFGMLGAIPTVLLVVALGGRWVAGRALGPVEALRQAAARITPRHLDERLPLPEAKDEIAGLVSVLNHTFDRLERSFEQANRFSAEASHHLKTPLSVLRVAIEEILTDPNTPAPQQERASELLHHVHQLTSIAENLLLLARADAGRLDLRPEEFDLRGVLDGVCDDARALAEADGINVETKVPLRLPLVGDRPSIALIVQNLVENAMKYNERGGTICIYAQSTNGSVEVRILNNGSPIPAERAPHIFERFYRARADARIAGAGLGLSISSELAKANGGDLDLVRSDSEWTEFRLTLPLTAQISAVGASNRKKSM
jgi:signal transduction histidine kinase